MSAANKRPGNSCCAGQVRRRMQGVFAASPLSLACLRESADCRRGCCQPPTSKWLACCGRTSARATRRTCFSTPRASPCASRQSLRRLALRTRIFDEKVRVAAAGARRRPIGCGCIAQVYRAYLALSSEASLEDQRDFLRRVYELGAPVPPSGKVLREAASVAKAKERGESQLPPIAVAVKVLRPGTSDALELGEATQSLLISTHRPCSLCAKSSKHSSRRRPLTMRRAFLQTWR